MTVRSRKDTRSYLSTQLNGAITSAQRVDGYQRTDLQGESPVVRVMSAGAERPAIVTRNDRSRFRFAIQTWVLFSEVVGEWTESQAEDAMDDIEAEVATWLSANQNVPGYWVSLKYDGYSTTDTVKVGGEVWLVETIPVIAEVYEP